MVKIETKQELQYMMQFHNIPYVTIKDGSHDMGKVTNDMKYEAGLYRYKLPSLKNCFCRIL